MKSDDITQPSSGKIIDLHNHQQIGVMQLIERLSQADYLLIGEQHDQIAHHQIERYLLQALQPYFRTIVFEMFNIEQQPYIDKLQLRLAITPVLPSETIKNNCNGKNGIGLYMLH